MESEVFDGLQVILKSGLSKVTALEFFQHYFSKSGHKDLLMTRQPTLTTSRPPARHPPLRSPHAQRPPRQRLSSNTVVLTKSFGPDERPCIVERTFAWLGKCATTGSFISLAS